MQEVQKMQDILEVALDAAWQAGRITLGYFRRDITVERKGDSSPVTAADREAEKLIRGIIEKKYPGHAVVGEEYGESAAEGASHRWIIDPIDGTRSFVHGVPLYGVLIGLEVEGSMELGVVNMPALDEMYYAVRGGGAYLNGRRIRVSDVKEMGMATALLTNPKSFYDTGIDGLWDRIRENTRQQRGWGDCYGHMLVASGRAEFMFDPLVSIWDVAAVVPIVTEAGGTFTDWKGRCTIHGGNGISTNGHLYRPLMDMLGEEPACPPDYTY